MKSEKGMLVVEASVVFPVIFTVVFIMIFYGNACFQQARIQYIVDELAIKGAAYCADPLLSNITEKGVVPGYGTDEAAIKPYRFFIGGMSTVEDKIYTELKNTVKGLSSGLFTGMKVKVDWTNSVNSTKFVNNYICSFFVVKLQYEIPISVRFLGADDFYSLKGKAYSEIPVNDTVEFIRNVNMVEDFVQRSEEAGKIKDKISELMNKVKKWFNS